MSIRCSADQSGHGSPTVRWRERDPFAQRRRNVRPTKRSQLRRPHAGHQCRRRLVARLGSVDPFAELDRSEPPFDGFDEVVAVGVPAERPAFDDLGAELRHDVVGLDCCSQPDARPIATTIEISRHEKRLVGEWVVIGQPCAGPSAELELAGSTLCGQPIWIAEQEDDTGSIWVDLVELEADAGSTGQVDGPVAQAVDGTGVGGIVAAPPGQRTDAQCEVRRQVIGTAAEDVALLDERGDHARQR